MASRFPKLFSPLRIRNVTLKNRIGSTGHDTCLADHTLPGDALAAYHRARAKGGAGLIVLEVAGVHGKGFRVATAIRLARLAYLVRRPLRRLVPEVADDDIGLAVAVDVGNGNALGAEVTRFASSVRPWRRAKPSAWRRHWQPTLASC